MQLYRPPARWRAAVYDPRYQVSATLDTLPPSLPLFCTRISPNWYHVVVRDGIDYGELALAYAHADLPRGSARGCSPSSVSSARRSTWTPTTARGGGAWTGRSTPPRRASWRRPAGTS
ncbi:hypothetical protein HFP72_06845 [Nocardiopsis sp. ARC36]